MSLSGLACRGRGDWQLQYASLHEKFPAPHLYMRGAWVLLSLQTSPEDEDPPAFSVLLLPGVRLCASRTAIDTRDATRHFVVASR